jgi:hypothetical protein
VAGPGAAAAHGPRRLQRSLSVQKQIEFFWMQQNQSG